MKLVTASLLAAVMILAGATALRAAGADFVGTWQNNDPNATGVVKLVIDNNHHIRAFGDCTPNPCDYGAVDFTTYGLNVKDTNHRLGSGHWIFTFKDVFLTAKLTGSRMMKVEEFNRFTDKSNRQSYWMSGTYHKVSDSFVQQ